MKLEFLEFVFICFFSNIYSVYGCVDYTYDSFTQNDLADFIIESGSASVENGMLVMKMAKSVVDNFGVAVTLGHKSFFQYGNVTADVKMEMFPGAVYSLILMSEKTGSTDIRDEIDWEWVEKDNEVQTNFFLTDKPVYSVNGRRHFVNDIAVSHRYTIEWQNGNINWYIDNNLVRSANGTLPSLPSQVKMGVWDSGRTGNTGTINWAGGPIDWKGQTEIKMTISKMWIQCHSTSTTSLSTTSLSTTSSTTKEIVQTTPVLQKCMRF